MSKLTYVGSDSNWEGIYVDGSLSSEHHKGRLWPDKVLDVMDEEDINSVERLTVNFEVNGEGRQIKASFPSDLADIFDSDGFTVQ